MTRKLTLNCDLGEGFGPWKMGDDRNIMPLIDAANVACGGHAGDPSTMRGCVELAKRHRTEIGAHVSYPDKQGFGRRAMAVSGQELVDLVHYQIGALDGIARAHGTRVTYVKPHGALYHAMLADPLILNDIMSAVASWHADLELVVLATPMLRVRDALSNNPQSPTRMAKTPVRSGRIQGATTMAPITTAVLSESNPKVAISPAPMLSTT